MYQEGKLRKNDEDRFASISKLVKKDDWSSVVEVINDLRTLYPESERVAYTWILVAYKVKNYRTLLPTAHKFLNTTRDPLKKSKISRIISSAYYYIGDFERALNWQQCSIAFIAESVRMGLKQPVVYTNKGLEKHVNINDYLKKILEYLKSQDLEVIPFYGTLLGIERASSVITGDKDLDLLCEIRIFEKVVSSLEEIGFTKDLHITALYSNFCPMTERNRGITIDIAGYRQVDDHIESGFFAKNTSREWSFIQKLPIPTIKIRKDCPNFSNLPYPKNAAELLESLYGPSWTIPDSEWIPFLMDESAVDTRLLQFFICDQLCRIWDEGQMTRLIYFLDQAIIRLPRNELINMLRNTIQASINPRQSV